MQFVYLIIFAVPVLLQEFDSNVLTIGDFIFMFTGMYFLGSFFSTIFYAESTGRQLTAEHDVSLIKKNYGRAEVNYNYFNSWDEAEKSLKFQFLYYRIIWLFLSLYFLFWGIYSFVKLGKGTFLIISILTGIVFIVLGFKQGYKKRTKEIEKEMKR